MEPLNLLLVGCGMMGARHVRGLGELEEAAPGSVRLLAVCDKREDLAHKVAAEAEQLLGVRPAVFTDIGQTLVAEPDLEAADVVTDPRSHDMLVISLLEAGLDVICEKPLALTVARGRNMVETSRRTGRVLAVAENNRRDPMSRLARACVTGGLIGAPNFALQVAVNRGGGIIRRAELRAASGSQPRWRDHRHCVAAPPRGRRAVAGRGHPSRLRTGVPGRAHRERLGAGEHRPAAA